jgi:hypothetical protein
MSRSPHEFRTLHRSFVCAAFSQHQSMLCTSQQHLIYRRITCLCQTTQHRYHHTRCCIIYMLPSPSYTGKHAKSCKLFVTRCPQITQTRLYNNCSLPVVACQCRTMQGARMLGQDPAANLLDIDTLMLIITSFLLQAPPRLHPQHHHLQHHHRSRSHHRAVGWHGRSMRTRCRFSF